ncbi:MAG: YicC family protein [Phycisphaeraceae bacterium]|nr:YicC family protein [Phycisphaeraceae bacterium]
MTGFGDASTQMEGVHFTVELRTLNNRYFKAAIRLPDDIAGLEAELESLLRKRINRGTVTLCVKTRMGDDTATPRINDQALLSYLGHLETIRGKVGDQAVSIDLTALLALPGVLQPTDDAVSALDRARRAMTPLLDQACEKLFAMRRQEGLALVEDFRKHIQAIRQRLVLITARAPHVIEEYHQRLRNRVNELLARAELTVIEQDLIREVAVFAERSDVSEELMRLEGHLTQFEQILADGEGEPAGRTLDFLAQELLREANTIASKSNDAQISRAIVEVKGAIDRIKEQVQNVE